MIIDVKNSTLTELGKFLGFADGMPKVCMHGGCLNEPHRGCIYCTQCIYGQSVKVDSVLQEAKRRYDKLAAKRKDGVTWR